MKNSQLNLLATIVVASISATTNAAGGTGIYELPWNNPKEILKYHSCGCADACWVAEVLTRKTRKTIAKLRCDCENLYFSKGSGKSREHKLQETCSDFGANDKPAVIRRKIEELLTK